MFTCIVWVNRFRFYLSELPKDIGWPDLPITRAVPHPNGDLPLGHFSTQLGHRVESDLFLRCVFKVLEQKRDVFIWLFSVHAFKCV